MMASELEREAKQAITLIKSFSLELDSYSPESQVLYWLNYYRAAWIRDAIIEAVYQGRYKIISVQHILSIWKRRGQPVCHFTSGFEQVIAAQLGTPMHLSTSMLSSPTQPFDRFSNRHTTPSSLSTNKPHVANLRQEADIASSYSNLSDTLSSSPSPSIEAFPVKAENTLVEVYQASTPRRQLAQSLGNADTVNTQTKDTQTETMTAAHLEYIYYPEKFSPIQPFQPELNRKHLSRN